MDGCKRTDFSQQLKGNQKSGNIWLTLTRADTRPISYLWSFPTLTLSIKTRALILDRFTHLQQKQAWFGYEHQHA
jgi:hypothetical protein